MNDHDWLDEELRNLPDLTAPKSLLPRVMERVQERAGQPIWIRVWREHWILFRNSSLGLSIALLILLLWLNPARMFSSVISVSPVFRVTAEVLDIVATVLSSGRIFQTPLWLVIVALTAVSYGTCILAASTVQRLATTRS
jgi:hypothetical protein